MTRIRSPSFVPLPFDKLKPLDSAHLFKDHDIAHDGRVLNVRTDEATNWWRVPERWETSGPVLGQWRDVPSTGFQLEAEIKMDSRFKVGFRASKNRSDQRFCGGSTLTLSSCETSHGPAYRGRTDQA